jgi:hypothetical protein
MANHGNRFALLMTGVPDPTSSLGKGTPEPMLPAQKQESQTETGQANPRGETVGFGKVLTSIQGLQRRLDDFSVDDVSQAEAKANTLIQQLSLLQEKLARFTVLNRSVSLANKTIGEIPEEHFEQVNLDGLENHPKLHAIIQASKLIRFRRLMKAAKADADAISFDAETGKLQIALPTTSDDASRNAIAPVKRFDTETHPSSAGPSPVVDEPVASAREQAATSEEKQWELGTDAETQRSPQADANESGDRPQFVSRGEHATGPHAPIIAGVGNADQDQQKSLSAIETNFDHRLLNDLIETYGEFVLTPVSSQQVGKPNAVKPKSSVAEETAVLVSKRAESAAVPALIEEAGLTKSKTPAMRKVDLPATVSVSVPEKLKAPQDLTLPAAIESVSRAEENTAHVHAEQIERKVPSARKNGELDRQLKRIIKDYGEYDLYSQQSSGKFKITVIAVFVLLGLVLGGLYFFKTPASNNRLPQAPSSSSRSDGLDTGARAAGQAASGTPAVAAGNMDQKP